MENNSNGSIEKDAVPTTSQTSTVERRISTGSELVDRDDNIIQTVGNNTMLANQTNTSAILTFKECTGITLGTFINVGWTPGMGAGGNVADWPAKDAVVKAEEKIGKTPTIKKMMDSTETISSAFLDVVSGNFGSRWRDVTILLNISHLFVDRMYEDHFERGGTKEVSLPRILKFNSPIHRLCFLRSCFKSSRAT